MNIEGVMAASRRHVLPKPRRSSDQDLASHRGDHGAVTARRDKAERDQVRDEQGTRCAALCRAAAKGLKRFPLIGREIVVEFGVHAASKNRSFRACLTDAA